MSLMLAAQLHGPRDLRIDEVEIPPLGDDDVLVRVAECGICPSDVRSYLGIRRGGSAPRYPRRIGHEWAGVIAAVGARVQAFRPGDRVAGSWRAPCGLCHHCRSGASQYCQDLQRERVVGGFAQFARVPQANVWKIPDWLSLEAATFCEPLACVVHGQEVLGIKPGDDVVVVGAGPIGQLHVQVAKAMGARVIAVDMIERRLEIARSLGADEIIVSGQEETLERVRALTGGKMADAVVVAASAVAAVEAGLQLLTIGGRMNIFAGIWPPGEIRLDPNVIHYRQLVLTGTHDYNSRHFTVACKLLANGTVRTEAMISHHLDLQSLREGFEIVAGQRGNKVMVRIQHV